MKRIVLMQIVAALIMAVTATAGVPLEWNYQGHLTDNLGDPLDTTVSMTFAIYYDSIGGTAVWFENHPPVSVMGGGFSVRLGSINPITDGVLDFPTQNPQAWLGVTVGLEMEMTPRTRLASVPYTYRVSTIDGASGGIISGDVSVVADSSGGVLEVVDTSVVDRKAKLLMDSTGSYLVLGKIGD